MGAYTNMWSLWATHHIHHTTYILEVCQIAAWMADDMDITTMELLDLPSTPNTFSAQIRMIGKMEDAWEDPPQQGTRNRPRRRHVGLQ